MGASTLVVAWRGVNARNSVLPVIDHAKDETAAFDFRRFRSIGGKLLGAGRHAEFVAMAFLLAEHRALRWSSWGIAGWFAAAARSGGPSSNFSAATAEGELLD